MDMDQMIRELEEASQYEGSECGGAAYANSAG